MSGSSLEDRDAAGQPIHVNVVLALACRERNATAVRAPVRVEAERTHLIADEIALRGEELEVDLEGSACTRASGGTMKLRAVTSSTSIASVRCVMAWPRARRSPAATSRAALLNCVVETPGPKMGMVTAAITADQHDVGQPSGGRALRLGGLARGGMSARFAWRFAFTSAAVRHLNPLVGSSPLFEQWLVAAHTGALLLDWYLRHGTIDGEQWL